MDPFAFDQDTMQRIQAARARGADDSMIIQKAARYQASKAQGSMQTTPEPAEPTQNKWASWLPLLGGIGGAFLPVPGGPILGAALGSAIGAGAGTAGKQMLQNQEADLGEVGREAGLSGLFGGIGGIGGKLLSKLVGGTLAKGSQSVLNTSPAMFDKLSQAGMDANKIYSKWAGKLGGSFDDMLGVIEKGGSKGNIGKLIQEAEQPIIQTVKTSGDEIVGTIDELLSPLQQEVVQLSGTVGNQNRIVKIRELMEELYGKYPEGFTAEDLLTIKREADSKFGKAVMEDEAGAVISQTQKKLANTARGILHRRFPQLGQALDDQSELFALEPILSRARAKGSSGALGVTGFDLGKPGTWAQPFMGNPAIGGRIAQIPQPGDMFSRTMVGLPGGAAAGAGSPPEMGQTLPQPGGGMNIPQPASMAMGGGGMDQQLPMGQPLTEQDALKQVLGTIMLQRAKSPSDIAAAYEFLYPKQEGQKTTQKQALFQGAADVARNALSLLEGGDIATGIGQNLVGAIGEKVGWNSENQNAYRANIAQARTIARNAMLGANMTEREMQSLSASIPEFDDAPSTARTKLKTFIQNMELLSQKTQNATSGVESLFEY